MVDHVAKPVGFRYIELSGGESDKAAMKEWVGEGVDGLPLRWVEGPPALKAVGIKTADGKTIVLE